ncbi:MAG: putative selenate reductase subunit YgfK [Lachnospiraceae bacterium]|nr:putative selenate reductase subunit YgfK [Lachnospiraceae bacterium]
MSEVMKIMPFKNLMEWVIDENNTRKSIFGIKKYYKANVRKGFNIYKEHIETPIGPAAGPNSQLAQNIIASYVAGARFFELKTVQEMNGEALAKCVNKPCIKADDECYNCEWSTELYMDEAIQEYIKAWVLLHFISKEYGLGASDGFVFNMSVGYNLDDIKKKDTDTFIECMKDATKHPIFNECKEYLKAHVNEFMNFKIEDIEKIPSRVCDSVTESTLHGCPPAEIERIAMYLMEEKGLNTFIKCNPTLLGYERARSILNEMGFTYVAFTDSHFLTDLQWADAIVMLKRLMEYADSKNLTFGVKLTNTFPVDVTRNELPSQEMYMSGKSLFALSIKVAEMLSTEFNGKLKIAYSGGADAFNIDKLIDVGIWPVTVATTILKPGGYDRFYQMADKIMSKASGMISFTGVGVKKVQNLSEECKKDQHLIKKSLRFKQNKIKIKNPLIDCFMAPCSNNCTINQDISLYNYYVKKGEFEKALEVIYRTNPLPFMTGNICAHPCTTACMRNHYEDNVDIRGNKLLAAKNAFDKIVKNIKPVSQNGKTVAIVGAGPGGIAAATFLSKEGFAVKVYDKEKVAGGTVANIIPHFRLPMEEIQKDVEYARSLGAKFELGTHVKSVKELKDKFDYVVLAIGAHKENKGGFAGDDKCINAHKFLMDFNEKGGKLDIGKNVAVIGGGNTAMDVSRAAKRTNGVENVYLIYRRNMLNAPADEDEINLAIKDGVEIKELLAPESYENGVLKCKVCKLGPVGADGRNSIEVTDEILEIKADTVIASIGEKVDSEFYKSNDIEVTEKGLPKLDSMMQTSINDVYAIGDGAFGASIIVKAIANAKIVSYAITRKSFIGNELPNESVENIYKDRAILKDRIENVNANSNDASRCLHCNKVCETCNEVCPNRANVHVILKDGSHQIVHIDSMCNECGNCAVFCPYESRPYKDKFTLFSDEKAMNDSTNDGFYYKNENEAVVRIKENYINYKLGTSDDKLGKLAEVIDIIFDRTKYMIF